MEKQQQALHVLQTILETLCDRPAECLIQGVVRDGGTDFHISPAPTDTGKLFGRGGHNLRTIRSVMVMVGIKHNAQYQVKLAGDTPPMSAETMPLPMSAPAREGEPACVHCGCTESNACLITLPAVANPAGPIERQIPCTWVDPAQTQGRPVCNNPECLRKEQLHRRRN